MLFDVLLHYIPSPPQGVWHLGPLPIRAYALMIIVGILAGLWLTLRRYTVRGGEAGTVYDAAIVIIIGGIVGGRLYHVITDANKYFCSECHPLDALKITNGGLGIPGALMLATVCVWILFRVKKLPLGPFADAIAPAIPLGQAFGRMGNWFNQELYGSPTTVPWGLEIYRRVDSTGHLAPLTGHSTGEVLTIVHPVAFYEALWCLVLCGILILVDRRYDWRRRCGSGTLFVLYVAGYTIGRFFIEFMRSDDATMILGLRVNTWTSALWFLAAVLILVLMIRRHRRREEKHFSREM